MTWKDATQSSIDGSVNATTLDDATALPTSGETETSQIQERVTRKRI